MVVTFDAPNIEEAKGEAQTMLRVCGYPLVDGSTITIQRIRNVVGQLGYLL